MLSCLQEAILNTEKYTLEEWMDFYGGLQSLSALKPHVDLIVRLRKMTEN